MYGYSTRNYGVTSAKENYKSPSPSRFYVASVAGA